LAKWAFGSLRYLPDRIGKSRIYLNREPYRQAESGEGPNSAAAPRARAGVVAAGDGHPRHHRLGFGDIFFANCFQNGILPIAVDKAIVHALAGRSRRRKGQGGSLSIWKHRRSPRRRTAPQFRDRSATARRPVQGLDEVALTLQRDDEIQSFQAADRMARPWIHFARTSA